METKLKVEQAKTADLLPYAHNAKEHPEWQVDQIAASIEQFGFNDPVGVWTNHDGQLEIVEGHGRVLAAKALGIEKLPIIRLDHLDDEGRRAYTHVHNVLTEETGFDWAVQAEDLKELAAFDFQAFGFELPQEKSTEARCITTVLQLTEEQHETIRESIKPIRREECELDTGNEIAAKVCEAVRRWSEN